MTALDWLHGDPKNIPDPLGRGDRALAFADLLKHPKSNAPDKALVLDPSTTAVAVVAGYRDPAGKTTRAKAAVSPTGTASFTVTAGPGGVVMAPA